MKNIFFLIVIICLTNCSQAQWSITGNAGTSQGTNFIGTTDNVPLVFKVNNTASGIIDNTLFNAFMGYQAGSSISTGYGNIAVGHQALAANTTGYHNTAAGFAALSKITTALQNAAFGSSAGANLTSGGSNTYVGHGAAYGAVFEASTVALGKNAHFNGNCANCTVVGTDAMMGSSTTNASNNTAIGYGVLGIITSGSNNVALGIGTMYNTSSGSGNCGLGPRALLTNTTGSNNTAIGFYADVMSNNLTNATAIGSYAQVAASNSIVLGGTGSNAVNVGIGIAAPLTPLHVNGNVLIGSVSSGNPLNPGYLLDVKGSVRANILTVNSNGADFVFEPAYKLKPLKEVESFVLQNHHLPEIEPAAEMQKHGVNVGDNQTKLLQKIEELTLYLFSQNKQMEKKDVEITDLKRVIKTMLERLDKLEIKQ